MNLGAAFTEDLTVLLLQALTGSDSDSLSELLLVVLLASMAVIVASPSKYRHPVCMATGTASHW